MPTEPRRSMTVFHSALAGSRERIHAAQSTVPPPAPAPTSPPPRDIPGTLRMDRMTRSLDRMAGGLLQQRDMRGNFSYSHLLLHTSCSHDLSSRVKKKKKKTRLNFNARHQAVTVGKYVRTSQGRCLQEAKLAP